MPIDLSGYEATGTNNPARQVSVTKWNNLLGVIEAGINLAPPATGGSSIFINVMDFGAVGDGVTDDLPAFNAALAYAKTLAPTTNAALFKSTPQVYVPTASKHYYLSGTLNIHQCLRFFGDGSGAPNGEGTTLRFGDNCNGIVMNEYRTVGGGTGSVGDASGAMVEGLTLLGGNVGYDGTTFILGDGTSSFGAGLRMRGTGQRVRDVQIKFFAEDGLNNITVSGGAADVEGNGNNFHIEDVWAFYNDGCGVRIQGTDSNAGSLRNINAIQNRLFGVKDASFLGNLWDAVHTRDNGIYSSTGLNLPTGMCSYLGTCYGVRIGQEVAASTTMPGTDSTVWYPCLTHPGAKPWVSGMTWAAGGPIATTDANAYSVFNNAYSESGQAAVQATSKTLFVNGALHDTPIIDPTGGGKAVWLRSLSGALVAPKFTTDDGVSLGGGSHFSVAKTGYTHTLSSINSDGKLGWVAANGGSQSTVLMITPATDTQPFTFTPSRLRVAEFGAANAADGGLGLNFISATSAANGQYLIGGDQFFKIAPSIGGITGWIVTTTGTGGSGAVLTPTGIVGGVQAAAMADIGAAPTQADFNALLAKLRTAKLMAT